MWKNVDGVFDADPNIVASAKSVEHMSYDEAIELAYFGGQVLHPSAIGPLVEDEIACYVRNVLNVDFLLARVFLRIHLLIVRCHPR